MVCPCEQRVRLPRPKKDALRGYHPTMTTLARHRAILRAMRMKKETPLSMGRHLSLLSTLTKRTIPKASKVYKEDSKWLLKMWRILCILKGYIKYWKRKFIKQIKIYFLTRSIVITFFTWRGCIIKGFLIIILCFDSNFIFFSTISQLLISIDITNVRSPHVLAFLWMDSYN